MDTYTPDGTTYHDTAELPTDSDYRSSASVRVGIEAALDNAAYIAANVGVFTYGGADGITTMASTAATAFGSADWAILEGVWSGETGQAVQVVACFHLYGDADGGAWAQLGYSLDGGTTVIGITGAQGFKQVNAVYDEQMTLCGTFICPDEGDCDLYIRLRSNTGQTVHARGPWAFNARKGQTLV